MVDGITGTIGNVFVIAVSFVVLNFASNLAINNAVKVASITRLGKTAVGFSIIAFSTSLPELTVAFIAAFSGGAALSVGNVLGSNIANISLIVGLAAVLVYLQSRRSARRAKKSGPVDCNIVPVFAKSELSNIYFGLFISSIIPIVLIFFSSASWLVGLILIGVFVGYMYQLSKVRLPKEDTDSVRLRMLGGLGVIFFLRLLVRLGLL